MLNITDFSIWLKNELFQLSSNFLLKPIIYFLSLLNAVFLKGLNLNIYTISLFILFITFIEIIFEFIVNPKINRRQQEYLSKSYGILAIPASIPLISLNVIGNFSYIAIPATFGVLFAILSILKGKFSSSRSIISVSIITFLVIIVNGGFNLDSVIVPLLILSFLLLAPIRLVQHYPYIKSELNEKLVSFMEKNKKREDSVNRYNRQFGENYSFVFLNDKMHFIKDGKLFDNYKNEISDEKLVKISKKILESKDKISKIIKSFKISKSINLVNLFVTSIISTFFSYEILKKGNRFYLDNYEKLNPRGNELDKKLFQSDIDLSIINDDLDEHLTNLIFASGEFLKIPSDDLVDLILEIKKDATDSVERNNIPDKINDRIKTAEELYKNTAIVKYQLYYNIKKTIDRELELIKSFEFLEEIKNV